MSYLGLKETVKRGESSFPLCLYAITGSGKQILPYHWHNEFEILYLQRGECVVRIGNSSYPVKRGGFVFINTGEIHSASRDNDRECIYDSIVFDLSMFNSLAPDDCQALANSLSMLKIIAPHQLEESPVRAEIGQIIEEIIFKLTQKTPGYEIYVKGSLYQIFSLLLEHGALLENKERKSTLGSYEGAIKKSMDYISRHYQNKIYLEELANQVQMSKFAFCKCFKQYMGVTPMEYINILRVNSAYSLLSTGEENVTGAALQCGFDNMSYFARTFKKYKGFPPSRAKNQH
jgi:AraC-like DNA-binding protein/quercetin dioxygenase-like cupin family protein